MNTNTQQQVVTAPAVQGQSPATITVGERWVRPKDGPWGGYYLPVTITGALDGWVRFDMDGGVFYDQRMREETFRSIYRREADVQGNAGARIADDRFCPGCGARGHVGLCSRCEHGPAS